MSLLRDRRFVLFVVKFVLLFCFFYFGTLAVIGVAAPGNSYSPFVEKYLDYVSWIKHSLIWGVKNIAALFGYPTVVEPGFIISVENKRGVIIAMDCVGYGVYSFWAAYVIAHEGRTPKKVGWVVGGLLLLWFINLLRITLFLIAINEGWPMPLGIDHHTWFNIVAYAAILLMIWRFEKTQGGSRGVA